MDALMSLPTDRRWRAISNQERQLTFFAFGTAKPAGSAMLLLLSCGTPLPTSDDRAEVIQMDPNRLTIDTHHLVGGSL
jgi:hypothetical protein